MRSLWTRLSLALVLTLTASSAWADGSDKTKNAAASDDGIRRDPNGVTGISPFMEKLVKGQKLVVARDFVGAVAAFRDAITESPNDPLGHFYLGEAQLLGKNLSEADASWQQALRFAARDDVLHAKVLFALADLRERQGKLQEAKDAWKEYGGFVAEHPKSKGFVATAGERQKTIEKELDMQTKYAEVRKRIAQRLKEVGAPPPDRPGGK